ncbi:hypothetical protein [Magnetospira sp. QH-2]|uniref:hypothetical protein n=1 Tax=Magnetospira sp. (strain QH-2) TaxID=1288970 RepID=UPI0011DDF37D|nr:hypothetical protein [Magnetospira sp. QH-2]
MVWFLAWVRYFLASEGRDESPYQMKKVNRPERASISIRSRVVVEGRLNRQKGSSVHSWAALSGKNWISVKPNRQQPMARATKAALAGCFKMPGLNT